MCRTGKVTDFDRITARSRFAMSADGIQAEPARQLAGGIGVFIPVLRHSFTLCVFLMVDSARMRVATSGINLAIVSYPQVMTIRPLSADFGRGRVTSGRGGDTPKKDSQSPF